MEIPPRPRDPARLVMARTAYDHHPDEMRVCVRACGVYKMKRKRLVSLESTKREIVATNSVVEDKRDQEELEGGHKRSGKKGGVKPKK